MPNFCPECGKKIEGTPKFCNECGHPLQGEARLGGETMKERPQYPWLFIGAFAKYYGMTIFQDTNATIEFNLHLEVVDIDQNNKRVKIQSKARLVKHAKPVVRVGFFVAKMKPVEKDSGERKMEEWMRIGDRVIFEDNAVLESESKGMLRVENLGVRKCIIEQYSVGASNEIVFWDEEFNWPMKYIVLFKRKEQQKVNYLSSVANMMTGNIDKSLDDMVAKSVLRERSLVVNMTETNIPWGPP
jgi:hypothetical protein